MSDYNTLLTDVANYLAKSNLTAQIPLFIELAQTEMYRKLRLQNMVKIASSTAANVLPGGEYAATVPDDCLQIKHVESGGVRCNYVSPDQMSVNLVHAFTIVDCLILVSGDATELDIYYYARPDNLTTLAPDNWFTSNAYDILLHLSVAEGWAYLMDEAREGKARQLADKKMSELQSRDDEARYTDNPLVQRG